MDAVNRGIRVSELNLERALEASRDRRQNEATEKSLVAQGHDRIDASGAGSGRVTRRECDARGHRHRRRQGRGIGGRDAVKQRIEESPQADAAGIASTIPIPTSTTTSRITMPSTFCRVAPSATRMPISRVRLATVYAITPYNPMAASREARKPKAQESSATMRSMKRDSSAWTRIDFTLKAGSAASSFAISRRA